MLKQSKDLKFCTPVHLVILLQKFKTTEARFLYSLKLT